MKTKIVRHSGYWRLISLEHKENGEQVELAIIGRDDFNEGKWYIEDWRLSKRKKITPYLSDSESRGALELNKKNLNKAKKQLKDYWIDESFNVIEWWQYDVTRIKRHSKKREYSRRRSVWSFTEARAYLGEVKRFWESFDGDILEAKIKNKFYQPFRI